MEDAPAVTSTDPSQIPQGDTSINLQESLNGLLNGEIDQALVMFIVKAGGALLTIVVAYFAAKLIARWVSSTVCRRVDHTLGKFAGKLSFYCVFSIVALTTLQTVGLSITSFAAILAAAGFAIGLAFQGTLSNFASGILLLVFRPFKVGDVVSVAGVTGKVDEIDLFTTTLDTPDNRRLILPNSAIAGTTIENISYHPHRRVEVVVGVAYGADLEKTREVLVASVESVKEKMVEGEGRGYQILCSNLGASSVDWTVRFWTKKADFFSVKETLTVAIKKHLDVNDIEIPFPQMQLHVTGSSEAHATHPSHSALPIPKMTPAVNYDRESKVRPRVRGDQV